MINKELLLAAWLEKLQKKWDTEEYYYDVEEPGSRYLQGGTSLDVFRISI